MSWKDLGDLLHDLSYKAYRITNFVLLQEYLYAMKEEHNPEYLNDKGKLYLYPAITRTYPELSSHVVNGISQNASKLFRTHAKGIFRGDETRPSASIIKAIPLPVSPSSITASPRNCS